MSSLLAGFVPALRRVEKLFIMNLFKTGMTVLLIAVGGAGGTTYAGQVTVAESRKAFIKIIEGDKHPGSPEDRDAPDVLYIRKSDVIRASIVFSTRSAEFRVLLVTAGPGV